MKRCICLFALILTLHASALDWQQYRVEKNSGGITLRGPNKESLQFYSSTKSAETLDASLEADCAVLKVASLQPKEIVKLRFGVFDKFKPTGARMAVKIILAAPGDQKCQIVMNGRIDPQEAERQKIKKNFWKCSVRPLTAEKTMITSAKELPVGLKDYSVWIDLTKPGEYRIYDCYLEPDKKASSTLEAGRNYVLNGGAERGFYGTAGYHFDYVKMHDSNLMERFNREKNKYSATVDIAVDEQEKHSGDCSFRLTAPQKSLGYLMFNPVPFATPQSAYLSCWMKGSRKSQMRMGLFLANGVYYEKLVGITPEWKRYEIAIPEWGKAAPGVQRVGDPAHGYSSSVPFCMPSFEPQENSTVWIDDVFYSVGVNRGDFNQEQAVTAGVVLDHQNGIYRPGETVNATLTLRNTADAAQRIALNRVLRDFQSADLPGTAVTQSLSLAPREVKKLAVAIRPPRNLRGPLNIVWDVNGEVTAAYCGILDTPRAPDPRLSVNVSWETNIEKAIEWFKEFRIGTVRTWGQMRDWKYYGMRYATPLHQAGIRNLYVMSAPDSEHFLPQDRTAWFKELAGHIDAHKGEITMYEFLNEFNLWRARRKNPDPKKFATATPEAYVEALADFHKLLKAHDPQALIAGPTPCGTDIPFILNILGLGANKYLDVITEHSYRSLPECPDYDEDLKSLQKGAEKFGKFRFAQTEAGNCKLPFLPDNLMEKFGRSKAARDTRNMLIGWANGLDHYSHFLFCFATRGCDWGLTLLGNGDTGFLPQPSVSLFAFRAAADRLQGAKFSARPKLGGEYRCYIFDRGDRRVAALWKWKGTPAKMTLTPELLSQTAIYDFTGSRLAVKEITLNEFPCYLETAATADALQKMLQASPREESADPLAPELVPLSEQEFAVRLTNGGSRFLDGTLTVNGENREFINLPPEDKKMFNFKTAKPISAIPQTVKLEIKIKDRPQKQSISRELRALLIPRAPQPLTINGDLADWPDKAKAAPLAIVGKFTPWGAAENNARAETRLCWDDNNLYCAVTVYKKGHFPPDNPGSMWKGDSLQLAFDTTRNAAREQKGFQDDDFAYDIALMNDKPVVNRLRGSSSAYDSLGKQIGIITDVPTAVKVLADRTVYEMAFPRASVSPFRLSPGSSMRINVLANIANAQGRAGYLQLTPGIGDQKRPGEFMDIILLDNK